MLEIIHFPGPEQLLPGSSDAMQYYSPILTYFVSTKKCTSMLHAIEPKFLGRISMIALSTVIVGLTGCKHEPLVAPEDPFANGGGGNGGQDTNTVVLCDTNIVFFQQQVLPILISNCAIPGCHNVPTDDNDAIQITSYRSLMNSDIVQDGDFWEALTEDDPDKIMPPPPQAPLTPQQLALINTWLQQGAQNNSCEPSSCDTVNVTYSGTIVPILQQKCNGCHSGSTPQGGLNFTAWGVVNSVANDGRLAAVIQHLPTAAAMPPSGPMISECSIDQFLIWIGDGAPNN